MDVTALGLVSDQITKHGRDWGNWPQKEFYHAIGLLLFTTIVGLVFGIFHYALNLKINLLLFLVSSQLFFLSSSQTALSFFFIGNSASPPSSLAFELG